jgi:hypothetical protein
MKSNPVTPQNFSQPMQMGMKVQTNLCVGKRLGDCCADLIHFTGLDKFANLYTQVTGKDCGCKDRQNWLNNLSPTILGK